MANNMDVASFISNFQGGGLRPNLFKVVLTFPNEVGGQQASNKIMFSCKATSLPASQIGVVNAPYMGRVAKFAGDRIFDDWNITVLLDTDMVSRDAFEKWSTSPGTLYTGIGRRDTIVTGKQIGRAHV